MYNSSGSGNLFNIGIGHSSLNSTRGADNIGIGQRTGLTNTTGYGNIYLGYYAGAYSTTGNANISIGYYSGNHIVEGSNNVILGQEAGGNNPGLGITMGSGNVGIGYQALFAISSSVGSSPFNVAIGFQSGRGITTGQGNIAIGGRAGYSIGTGFDNIYMGQDVGLAATTRTLSYNISLGKQSLTSNVSASRNIAIGFNSLPNTGVTASGDNFGNENVGIGYNAGVGLKTGIQNVFLGSGAGRTNGGNPVGNGNYNTFIGAESGVIQGNDGDWGNYGVAVGYAAMGYDNSGTVPVTPGIGNTALGSLTLPRISSSITTRNTAVGYKAGALMVLGANNTLLGAFSGNDLATGSNNIFIGDNSGDGIVSGSNNTIIGVISGLTASLNDTIIIGAGSTERIRINSSGSMGLGTTAPSSSAKLQIDSTTQGFLPPRMTNAQRTSIVSASIGLMVYCTDATEGLYINKSTGWTFIV